MNIKNIFSEKDLEDIKKAVSEAELKTSGEIVPYIVNKSDNYSFIIWRAAFLFGLFSGLIMVLINFLSKDILLINNYLYFFVIQTVFIGLGILLSLTFKSFKRALIGKERLQYNANLKAKQYFIEEEVFNTRERTGILIFISLFEKTVVVIGDSGINKKVVQNEWDGIIDTIISGIKQKRYTSAIIDAIKQCGNLLQKENVERRADDTNELNDNLRIGEL